MLLKNYVKSKYQFHSILLQNEKNKNKSIMVKTRAMVKQELADEAARQAQGEAEAARLYESIMLNLEKPIPNIRNNSRMKRQEDKHRKLIAAK